MVEPTGIDSPAENRPSGVASKKKSCDFFSFGSYDGRTSIKKW